VSKALKAAAPGFRPRLRRTCAHGPWLCARRRRWRAAGRVGGGNVRRASGAERRRGTTRGKSSEGMNPRSATGMKQARRGRGGASRQEGAKPWRRNVPGLESPGQRRRRRDPQVLKGAKPSGGTARTRAPQLPLRRRVAGAAVKPCRGCNSESVPARPSGLRRPAALRRPRGPAGTGRRTRPARVFGHSPSPAKDEAGARNP
jgi:hypothetical protein